MKIKVLCFLVGWVLGVGGLGAQGVVDSLERILAASKSIDEAVLVKVALAEYYIYHNLDSADYYISEVFRQPGLEQYLPKDYSHHLLVKAWVHQGQNDLEKAQEYMEQVEAIVKRGGNREDLLVIQYNLASVLVQMRSSEAMSYVNRCQSELDTTLEAEQIAWLHHQYFRGRIYGDRDEYTRAIEELLVLLRTPFLDEHAEHKSGIFNTLGIYLSGVGNKRLAITYGEQALESEGVFVHEVPSLLTNIAGWYLDLGELDSCQYYLTKVGDIPRLEDVDCRSYYYGTAGLADAKGDYKATVAALEKGRACMKNGLKDPKFTFLFDLAEGEAWCKLGNTDRASALLKRARALLEANEQLQRIDYQTGVARLALRLRLMEVAPESVSIYDDYNRLREKELETVSDKKLKEALVQYQTEKKELQNQALQLENELQAKANRNQRLGLGGLSLGLAALAGLSLFLYRQRQRIQAQKAEIELLNREQRHRMMNNLVFANSLMGLQVKRLEEQPEARQAVKEAEARLRAMSALHRRLHHEGEGQKSIDLHGYLKEITAALQGSFSTTGQPLAIELHGPEGTRVDGEAAMRIGLIVNELATNSCKHAFAEQPQPQIDVHLIPEGEGRYRLIYTDNGSGLPADFEIDTQKSMGLYLIHNLVKQLNGRIAFSGESGTRVECELNLETV